jgi:hypothetical protein
MKTITVIVTVIITLAFAGCNSGGDYFIKSEEINATGAKATVEIVLSKKEPKEKLEEISTFFRKKHKTKNVLVRFFLTNTQKHNYASADWHGDKFDGVSIYQPVYGDLNWFIDSLNVPGTEIIGVWGDTLEVPYIIGIIRKDGDIVLKSGMLDNSHEFPGEIIQLKNNKYINKDNPDGHESYSIAEDGNLNIYCRFYDINGERLGGELQEILPPLDYKKAAD